MKLPKVELRKAMPARRVLLASELAGFALLTVGVFVALGLAAGLSMAGLVLVFIGNAKRGT